MVIQAKTEAENRLRLVIDTIPVMAWSLRSDGAVDFVNQRWIEYTGLSLEEALEESKRIVHPEDLPRAVEKWLPNMAAGNPHEDEMRLLGADGKYRWFLVRIAPLRDEQGKVVKWYGTSTDIEDRRQAEVQSRTLIDAIPHQIWSGPADGTTDYCNNRWRSYAGLELEDVRGYGWQTMVHPGDRDRVLKAWREAVANGTPYEQEERHRGADGTYRWFLSLGIPLRDADGRIVRWYGTNTDIEDRKQFEVALNAQALRYKTLMETSTDSIYVLDAKGNLQEANPAFLRRRGYTAAEGKGLNVADWDAQWSREQLRQRRRKLVGKSTVFETRHRCKDGSIFDVEVCATSVQIGGEKLLFCMTRDITERKQAEDRLRRSEEKFKTLFGIVPVGIAVLDSQLQAVDCNPALERISRLSRGALLGDSWRQHTYLNADGSVRPPGERVIERAVTQNRLVSGVETGVVMENGEIIWAEVSVAPLALPDVSAVVIAHDITERKRAARDLEEANHQLRVLSRQLFHLQEEERRHLARELHDEIGQTLTAAKMNLEIILPHVPEKVTGRLQDSVQLLDGLLTQVRHLSLALRPPLLDELGLVPTLRWLVEQQAQRAGLRTEFYAPDPFEKLGSEIQTAGFRIAQEAITNVLRHAKAQSVSVHLEIDGDQLRMKIVDDGNGFELAEVERRAHEGLGFGLTGMRERAALVGGRVRMISSPDKGTSVEVSLPLNGSPEGQTG